MGPQPPFNLFAHRFGVAGRTVHLSLLSGANAGDDRADGLGLQTERQRLASNDLFACAECRTDFFNAVYGARQPVALVVSAPEYPRRPTLSQP